MGVFAWLAGARANNDQFLGQIPSPIYGEAAVDGDAYPFAKAPVGTLYVRKVDSTHVQFWVKGQDNNADSDWHGWGIISEQVLWSDFTDGEAAVGTYVMVADIPAGALVEQTFLYVNTAFDGTGVSTVTLTVGDGTDADRYNTGTPSIATAGHVSAGAVSGTAFHATAVTALTLTGTEDDDWTDIDAGAVTVTIHYKM